MDKTMKSWKIEAEQQLIWGTTASGDSPAGTAREMRGLFERIQRRTALLVLLVRLLSPNLFSTTNFSHLEQCGC
jgi:hypothetical protein